MLIYLLQATNKNMSKKPLVLYYHPSMEPLANRVIDICKGQDNNVIKGSISWKHFHDGWPNLFINHVKKECAGQDVIFIGSLHSPEIIFEQISILYSLPRYLSRSVTFILPYFPTATMERIDTEGSVATAATLARILSATPLSSRGPCQIVIIDIHALQERFYFGDNVIPRLESAVELLLDEIKEKELKDVAIVFPDDGAFKRFHSHFVDLFPVIICTKIREGKGRIVRIKEGDATKCHCIIVDDLVMTGGTLIECANALKIAGAAQISAFVTHAVFPKESWKKFTSSESLFTRFYISDSIPHASEIAKNAPFVMLSLANILSKILFDYNSIRQ